MRAIGWLLLAFALPIWLYGNFVVSVLYGDRWASAGQVLPILAFVGFTRGLARATSPMLLALGRQDFDAKAKAVETAVFIVLILVFVGWLGFGMIGAAWSGLGCYGLAALVRIVFLSSRAPLTVSILLAGLARMLAAALLVGLISSAVIKTGRLEVIPMIVVFVSVILTGWFSEPELRASVMSHTPVRS